ncbi:MAG: hypothetical protein JOZ72_03070 [Alphaproteobacteria bacterium]|nr:hypothetical protein [Alphaproteobacteria bacterium]
MRRFISSLALALAVAAAWVLPASADDPYSVGGIHVDASAQSASQAQLSAMAQGRPKAWAILFKRVAKPQDQGKLPQLDDAMLQRIIKTFTVKNEKRSTTRYVADVTYTFSPEGVARVMQSGGLALGLVQPKHILLVPFSPNYSSGSMWTAAFSGSRYANAAVPFSLPTGADQAALGALGFESANWIDVEGAAARAHASEAALVMVQQKDGHLTVTIKRIGAGQLPAKTSLDVPLQPGGAAGTYSIASDAAVKGIEDMWKTGGTFAAKGSLTADLRIASLAQWGAMQQQMMTVPNVTGITVLAMDIGQARVQVAYLGNTDQLREALSGQGISLAKAGGEWTLSNAGTP